MPYRRRLCPPILLPGMMQSNMMPPVMYPPVEYLKVNQFNHMVPHIHPIQETILNSHMYQNQHFFPQTYKVVNQAYQC